MIIGQNVNNQRLLIRSNLIKGWWAKCMSCSQEMVKPTRDTDAKLDNKAVCFVCGQKYQIKLEGETLQEYEERNWNEKKI